MKRVMNFVPETRGGFMKNSHVHNRFSDRCVQSKTDPNSNPWWI